MRVGRAAEVVSRLVLAALLSTTPGRAEIVNRIVATVDDEPITADELARYAKERGAGDAPEEQLLDALITDKLLEREAKALGISVKDEDVDRYIEGVKQRARLDDEGFTKALGQQGLSLDQYKTRVRSEIAKMQLVNREIRGRVTVSPEEIERHYQDNADRYRTGGGVTVRDIFLAVPANADPATVAQVRAKAEEVRQMVLDGGDFGELARQHSQGPGADKGGLLGTFAPGQMEPALDRAAFALKPGEVSEPIPSARGFHLLRVDRVSGSGSERSLDDVREEIREQMYNEALQTRFEEWLSKDLRERHRVEVLN